METLVIHPKDDTTDFLIPIYWDKGYTVITDIEADRDYVRDAIKDNDRIIMLGHGSTDGLFGGNPLGTCYIIDSSLVPILRTKDTVCIWCNANVFVEKYKLAGFYTGMMISEIGEAIYCSVSATQEDIDYSNKLFSRSVREAIHCLNRKNMQYLAKSCYKGNSEVIKYNRARIFQTTEIIDNSYTGVLPFMQEYQSENTEVT